MQQNHVKSALILGVCLLLGLTALGYLLGTSALKFKAYERTVTVKGLSEREYPADIVIWPISFVEAGNDLTELYLVTERHTQTLIAFLEANGIERQELTVSAPGISDKLAQGYEKARIEFRYMATQTVTVYSSKIDTVRAAMNKMGDLGKQGIAIADNTYEHATEYLFTRLNEVKPSMIEEATTQAREVAEKFAKDSKSRLGKIKRASQGQFSIGDRDRNNPHIKKVRVVSTIEYYLSD